MKPFKQTESGMTKTAKVLSPNPGQTYNGTFQQNVVREKLQEKVVSANINVYQRGAF